jgi:hypothetical protein
LGCLLLEGFVGDDATVLNVDVAQFQKELVFIGEIDDIG